VESLLMDADNRVVLNCGGIRHEAYKVKPSTVKKLDLDPDGLSVDF
jgi:hypothetical protein